MIPLTGELPRRVVLHCGDSVAVCSGKFGPVLCEVSKEEEQFGSLWQLGEVFGRSQAICFGKILNLLTFCGI